jgi:hypothetical protein
VIYWDKFQHSADKFLYRSVPVTLPSQDGFITKFSNVELLQNVHTAVNAICQKFCYVLQGVMYTVVDVFI